MAADDSEVDIEQEELKLEDLRDVSPIYNDENECAAVRITYTEKFSTAMAYLRAMFTLDERSERALHVTTVALRLNPSNYTAWHYRRNILQSLNSDLKAELDFAGDLLESNPKNYQLWHHRNILVGWAGGDAAKLELEFAERMLQDDAKNYHAWQHRVHMLNAHNLWASSDELALTTRMIAEDVRNNSAWHHRYGTLAATSGFTQAALQSEVAFCLDAIDRVPFNESAWSYLRGLLSNDENCTKELLESVRLFCAKCMEDPKKRCSHLLSFVVDDLIENQNENDEKERMGKITQSSGRSAGEYPLDI